MAENNPFNPLRSDSLQRLPLPKTASSSSISDMRGNESQKLRVLIASCGSKDVAQAQALVVRLSKNTKIETRAVVDEQAFPHRLSQETPTLRNMSFRVGRDVDEYNEYAKNIERGNIEFYRQQAYDLCTWADMLVLAPIDADTFAKMLHGITDCLLLEILRGWDVSKKILLVPGMSTAMWENPMTKKQLSKVRRKWQWVRVMQPILWFYEDERPTKCLAGWDGFNELVDVIKNQAELMSIGHDVDIAAAGAADSARHNVKTNALLPPEVWTIIFEYIGDWEVAKALNVYTNIPTPVEWQRPGESKNDLNIYMRSLEWTMLTSPVPKIVEKLEAAPEVMKYLSSLCVKLVIKFCLIDILTYLEGNFKDLFWSSFGQKLLPTKASAVYGRTEILEWWRTSPTFLSKDYTAEAIDGASKSGFVHVLDWWRKSGLPLKYTSSALEQASSKGHILVLEWWKQASLHQGNYHVDAETRHRHGLPAVDEGLSTPSETQPALKLKPGKSLVAAAQNNQVLVLRWWENSEIEIQYADSVAKVASQHGFVDVLDAWLELRGEKMTFDNQVLVQPTKNGHVEVLEWWKKFSQGGEGRPGGKVEYKTCDIEEALEDSVGSQMQEMEVKRWWAKNGLNLGVDVSEWTKVKLL
ncbi:Phosphopantothenoylcysteine decarboxylase [Hyphodiscus hymeniophilus]|uniref:Phosphopantothenoylcysteine decarboxylase n=1 Tax=Hyphodiscus hymeniophilus TaxID=353542 RepID=A0A9P6VDV9_9HELO|nr:Phosphopantothenoylcysteine decarboxylase [Hyphodiscus hymeniophilus]